MSSVYIGDGSIYMMLTGPSRTQVDQVWNAFWPGGISNLIQVIEQNTCLLFLRRLDDLQQLE